MGYFLFLLCLFFLFFCGPVTLSWSLVICQQRLLWLISTKLDLGWSTVKYHLYPKPHSIIYQLFWVLKSSSFLGIIRRHVQLPIIYYKRLKRHWRIPTPQNKSESTTPRNIIICKSGLLCIWLAAVIQLNLSTTATLGTEKSGRCREV